MKKKLISLLMAGALAAGLPGSVTRMLQAVRKRKRLSRRKLRSLHKKSSKNLHKKSRQAEKKKR